MRYKGNKKRTSATGLLRQGVTKPPKFGNPNTHCGDPLSAPFNSAKGSNCLPLIRLALALPGAEIDRQREPKRVDCKENGSRVGEDGSNCDFRAGRGPVTQSWFPERAKRGKSKGTPSLSRRTRGEKQRNVQLNPTQD